MLLDDLKDFIKDMEDILIKDSRFKENVDFKNQIKTIYKCKPKYKPYPIPIVMSNLQLLGAPQTSQKPVEIACKACQTPKCICSIDEINKLKAELERINKILEDKIKIEEELHKELNQKCATLEELYLLIEKLIKKVYEAYDLTAKIDTTTKSDIDTLRELINTNKYAEARAKLLTMQ